MVLSLADTSCCCPLSGRNRDCSLATEGKSSFLNSLTNSTRESYTSIMKSCASKIKVGTHPTVTLMSPAFREFFKAAACRLLVWCLKNRGWKKVGFYVFLSEPSQFIPDSHVSHLTPGIPTLGCQAVRFAIARYPLANPEGWCASVQSFWSVDFDVNFLMSFCCDFLHLLTDMISCFKYTLQTRSSLSHPKLWFPGLNQLMFEASGLG